MSPKRAAATAVAIFLVAVWLANAAGVRRAGDQVRPEPAAEGIAPADAVALEIAAQTARLRARTGVLPAPRVARNPFEFAAPPPAAHAPEPPVEPVEMPPPPPPALTPRPMLALIGVAQAGAAADSPRTAIISGLGEVFLLKAGDALGTRFKVLAIGADAVQLQDSEDGSTFVLPLR